MSEPRILIAEDERIVAEDIKRTLEQFGYEISSIASSGEEAVKKAQEEKPDLILMDIVLKGELDGIEAAQQIYERLNIPVVFLTAYADEGTLARAKIIEPYGYVVKPFDDRALRVAVEMSLSKYEMEIKVKESGQFSSSLLTNSPNPIIVINPDTSVRYVNPALKRLTGFSAKELIGVKSPYPWWTEETLRKTKRDLKKAMSRGAQKLEEIFQKKSGERFWVEITSQPIKESGQFKYYLANWVDITERKLVEEKLRESKGRLKMLFEFAPDGYYVNDPKGIFIDGNKAAEEITGYKREELIGKSFLKLKLLPLNQIPKAAALLARNALGKHTGPDEFTLNRKDGGQVPVEISAHPIKVKGQTLVLGIARDITERKRAEEALKESEAQKKAILDASVDRIRLVDKDLRIIWANETHARELSRDPGDLLGKYCYEAFVGRNAPCPECPGIRALSSGRIEHTVLTRSEPGSGGEVRYLDSYAVPIKDDAGEIVHILNITRDITGQKKAEEEKEKLESQLLHAQKMEAVGTLAGGIAHDFNNLLMGILGYTSLMLMDIDHTHPHYERLQGIENQVQSGADLTRQLLGFARGGKYEVKPTDLNEIVKKTSSMFGRTKKEINIHRKYQKDLWPIEADQGQIEQVLLNLYVNAWQAMHGEGELYLETQNVTLDEEYVKPYQAEPGRFVKISITDTGIGMDESTRQRIFEPFFTTKEMGRGTGLGLASAYGIIKNHGGYINVYSEKGKGTTFTIYLPASDKEAVKEEKLPEKVLKGTETVLLVDDEEVVIAIGKEMLKALGYEVLVARSGREATELYAKNKAKIDLVILDMIMPEMGGGGVYDQLKEIDPEVKVLLSSGYGIEGQAREILERGCNGFIQKPFDTRRLSRKIREVLEQDD